VLVEVQLLQNGKWLATELQQCVDERPFSPGADDACTCVAEMTGMSTCKVRDVRSADGVRVGGVEPAAQGSDAL
jgi:hypothetical protein